MGVQKSNLNKDKIKNLLKKEYNIQLSNISEINRGT